MSRSLRARPRASLEASEGLWHIFTLLRKWLSVVPDVTVKAKILFGKGKAFLVQQGDS